MSASYLNTISFIPEYINRKPSVHRGMTLAELALVISSGAIVGGIIGFSMMLLTGLGWYLIPAGMGLLGWLSTRFGGSIISRLKRGKPESWLDRYIEFKIYPSRFINQNSTWSILRSSTAIHRIKRK